MIAGCETKHWLYFYFDASIFLSCLPRALAKQCKRAVHQLPTLKTSSFTALFSRHTALMINPDEAMKTPLSRPSATFQLKVGARSSDAPRTQRAYHWSVATSYGQQGRRVRYQQPFIIIKKSLRTMHHVLGAPL